MKLKGDILSVQTEKGNDYRHFYKVKIKHRITQ